MNYVDLPVVGFFATHTFGQWIVITLVGMAIVGVLGFLGSLQENSDEPWFGIIVGAFVYLFLFFGLTVVLWIVSFCMWLWNL